MKTQTGFQRKFLHVSLEMSNECTKACSLSLTIEGAPRDTTFSHPLGYLPQAKRVTTSVGEDVDK